MPKFFNWGGLDNLPEPRFSYKTRYEVCDTSLRHDSRAESLEVYPLGDLCDVLVWEGTLWVKVVTALTLHTTHQTAHVRCKTVLWRRPGEARTPEMNTDVNLYFLALTGAQEVTLSVPISYICLLCLIMLNYSLNLNKFCLLTISHQLLSSFSAVF